MRRKYLWLLIISLCTALSVQAAPGDGTFTFRIEGPQEERADVTSPATNPPRQVAPAARARTPVTSATTYNVQPSDTIWAIAHRFMPANGQANEFQAVASIYRNNPNAFTNQNVNNLRRTTLNIPSAQAMAQEDPQVGADLLREGRMTLPPLGQAPRVNTVSSQTASTSATSNTPASTNNTSAPNQTSSNASSNTEPATLAPREFVARETMLRQGERNFENPTPEDALLQVTAQDFYSDNDGSRSDAQGNTVNSENDTRTTTVVPEVASLNEIDFQVIRELIDSTNKAIEESVKVVDKKLSDALERSESVATSAATVAAREEVSEVMARYESLISDLQQSNAELRANISKLGKQIDQVRSVSLENSDKLNLMREQFVDVNSETSGGALPQGPMMWILLGLGLMCLILVSTLFIFKRKSRQTQKVNNEVDDFIDDSPTELISTQVLTPEERATLMKEQEREAHEMAKREVEKELAQEARKALEAENQKGLVEESEVQIPQSMFEQNQDLARKAQEQKDREDSERAQKEAEQKAREEAFEKEKAEAEKRAQEQAEALAAQQKALDEQRALLEAQTKALNDQKAAFNAQKALDTKDSALDEGNLVPKSPEVEAPATSKLTNDPEISSLTESGSAQVKEDRVTSNASQASEDPKPVEEMSSDEQELMQSWKSMTKPSKNLEDRLKKSQQELMKAWEAAAHDDANDKSTLNAWAEALKDDEQQKAHKAEIQRTEDDKVLSKAEVAKGSESVLTPDEKMEHDLKAALESQKQEAKASQTDDEDHLSAEEKAARDWQAALGGQQTPPKPKKLSADEQMALDWANAMQDQTQSVSTLSEDVRPKTKAPDESQIGADGAQNLADQEVKPQDTKELTHEVLPEGESSEQALDLQHALIDKEIEVEAQGLKQALDKVSSENEKTALEDLPQTSLHKRSIGDENLQNATFKEHLDDLQSQEKNPALADLENEEAALALALAQGANKEPNLTQDKPSDLKKKVQTTPTDEVLSPEELAILKGQDQALNSSQDQEIQPALEAEVQHQTSPEEVLTPEEIAALEGKERGEKVSDNAQVRASETAPSENTKAKHSLEEEVLTPEEISALAGKESGEKAQDIDNAPLDAPHVNAPQKASFLENHDPESFFNNEKNFDEALDALVKSNEQYYPNVKHQPFEIDNYEQALDDAKQYSDLENFKSSFERPLDEMPPQKEEALDPISLKAKELSESFKHSSAQDTTQGETFTWEILDDDNPLIEEFKRQSQNTKALDHLELSSNEGFDLASEDKLGAEDLNVEDENLEDKSALEAESLDLSSSESNTSSPEVENLAINAQEMTVENADHSLNNASEIEDLKADTKDTVSEQKLQSLNESESADLEDELKFSEENSSQESRLKDPSISLQEDHEALLNMLSSKSVDKSLNHDDIVTSPLSDDDLVNMLSGSKSSSQTENIKEEEEVQALGDNEKQESDKPSKRKTSRKRKSPKESLKESTDALEQDLKLKESKTEESANESQESAKPLSRELKEKLNYDLNLALVFFETGDQDEARELIDGIIKQGSPDLVAKAKELAARYGA